MQGEQKKLQDVWNEHTQAKEKDVKVPLHYFFSVDPEQEADAYARVKEVAYKRAVAMFNNAVDKTQAHTY